MTATAPSRPDTPLRLALALLLGAYLLALAFMAWNPQPDAGSAAVVWVDDVLHVVGLSAVSATQVEFGLNVVMFVQLGLLGSLALDWHGILRWLGVGFACSFLVEVSQWVLLPARTGAASDVVANTLGAGLGAVLAMLVVRLRDRV